MFGFIKETPQRRVLRTGMPLNCLTCGFDQFFERRAQLNTSVATFFGLDWTSPTGECCVCGRCGFIHWFLSAK
jgi:hypothetical protein